MASLITYVHVSGPDGRMHVFGPGDDVPDWATARITNPDVWDEPPGAGQKRPQPAAKRAARRGGTEG